MSLDPPSVYWHGGGGPAYGAGSPCCQQMVSSTNLFHSTSLQPLILKGFDKSPQLNIK